MTTTIILAVSALINIGESYFKGPTSSSYFDAASYCESQGTKLASIKTETEWIDAKLVCGSQSCWIGLRDDLNGNDDMIWAWDDNSDITTSYGFNADKTATTGQGPWNTNEPNEFGGFDEDCVFMYVNTGSDPADGKYNDAACDYNSDGLASIFPLCNDVPVPRYIKGSSPGSYYDAAAYCQSEGTTLASIVTEDEWNEAKSICGSTDCWIGLRDDLNGDPDMVWSWDDGSDVANSYGFYETRRATTGEGPWNPNEPNEYQGMDEDCVLMYANTGKYNDARCEYTSNIYPLCNQPPPPPPKRYVKGSSPGSYTDAAAYCQSEGTTLASIVTETEWNDAKDACGSTDCWIGLRDDLNGNDDNIWAWDDGSDITNSYGFNSDNTATIGQGPWNTNEPNEWNGIDEDCVFMYANTGKYNDAQCGYTSNIYPLCIEVNNDTPSSAQSNDKIVDGNDHITNTSTSQSQNRIYIIVGSVVAGLSILCVIFGMYLYRRKNKAYSIHKYVTEAQEDDLDEVMEGEDVEMTICNDGNLELENEKLKEIAE